MFRQTSNIFAFRIVEQIAEEKSSHKDQLEFHAFSYSSSSSLDLLE